MRYNPEHEFFLPPGTLMFHGTSEEFPKEEIHGGGYDDVIWTADNSVIAQTYIPVSGGTSYVSTRAVGRPSKDDTIQALQRIIGLDYDLSDVKWNYMDEPTSFRLPDGWDHLPERDEIAAMLESHGFKTFGYGNETFEIATTYRDTPDGETYIYVHGPNEKLEGRLFVFRVEQPFKVFDYTFGGERESDLMNVDYHNIPLFRKVEALGYDGIKINDFAQTDYYGNLGHTSIGIFEQALPKLSWITIPATNFEYDDTTPISLRDSPEYLEWLRGQD